MPTLSILVIAIGLAMDAFAVSIASGITIKRLRLHHALLIASAFGLFQAVMPILGWGLGSLASPFLLNLNNWIAAALLIGIGGHMIVEARQIEEAEQKNPLKPAILLTLAVATSLDAFAVGLTLSMLQVSIIRPVLIIGAVTFVMAFAGAYIGELFGHLFEKKLEIAGGILLIGMGLKIGISQLWVLFG